MVDLLTKDASPRVLSVGSPVGFWQIDQIPELQEFMPQDSTVRETFS